MNLIKKTQNIHILFLSFLAIYYVVPLIFINEVTLISSDTLDAGPSYNHIISKIYKGDIESLNYLLNGKIKWYYLDAIFYPFNLLHFIADDKIFYFTEDILKKLFSYFSFYLLAKSFNLPKFHCGLTAVLYASLVFVEKANGFGMAFFPYILYLLLNKDILTKKHYFFLFLIGLNTTLIQDLPALLFLIPLPFILSPEKKKLDIYVKVFSTFLFATILVNTHIILGSILGETIHREDMSILNFNFAKTLLKDIETFLRMSFSAYNFIFYAPLAILSASLLSTSIFLKKKIINLLFLYIIFILICNSIAGSNLTDYIFIGKLEILKGYNLTRLDRATPITFCLLLIFVITNLKNSKIKYFLYTFSLVSVLFIQLKTPLPILSSYFFKKNMDIEKFDETKKYFVEKEYVKFFSTIFDEKSYKANKNNANLLLNKTFDTYFKYNDYLYIKNIVKKSRIMSVGLDPMVAVMNDIRVIDGYHNIYPLSYKKSFRKIIERELEANVVLKNYYDDWGNRVYAFYSDQNNLMLNFQYAKKLGAKYILSRFSIKNEELKEICFKCNQSDQMFLYKIL
ncbi:MAG: hypothetical protein FD546_000008 [Pelagibacterales bacterium]|nr:hypothetical protein [Pelagibacterales bacterium]